MGFRLSRVPATLVHDMEENTIPRLLVFMGRECAHCLTMESVLDAVEEETGHHIDRIEVWHNTENSQLLEEVYADTLRPACGGLLGVPAFYNEGTGEALCGEQEKDVLIRWALGEPLP